MGYHLYRTAADGGEPRIVSPISGEYIEASFSPNGKALFFKYEEQDLEVYHLPRLYRVPWPAGGDAVLIARDFDREASRYALTPDSKQIYLLVPDAGKENSYQVAADGGKPALVIEPVTGGYTLARDSGKSGEAHSNRHLRQFSQSAGNRTHRSGNGALTAISPA